MCALSVAVYHFEGYAVDFLPAVRFQGFTLDFLGSGLNIGTIAVQVFFMLSGILTVGTLGNVDFSCGKYYRKRFARLYVPLWIAWLMVCLWTTYWYGGIFFSVSMRMFPLAVLGLDGYLSTTPLVALTGGTGFYLVGEWFFGALVFITLLWPFLRHVFLRSPKGLLFSLGLLELVSYFSTGAVLGSVLSCLPIEGLFSFVLGVYLASKRDKIYGNICAALIGGGVWL